MNDNANQTTFLTLAPDLRIAYEHNPGGAPYIVFLPGFNSNMRGRKGEALKRYAQDASLGFLRFDYRGHGESTGRLADGSVDEWFADTFGVIDACALPAYVCVGASMGGWIGLLLARRDPDRVRGVVGIGTAPDASDMLAQSLDDAGRAALECDGIAYRPSRYGDGPYPVTRKMIEAGATHRVLDGDWQLQCPVHLLHGLDDPDVSWTRAVDAARVLNGESVAVTLVKDGDHRLSRERDLRAMEDVLSAMLALQGVPLPASGK